MAVVPHGAVRSPRGMAEVDEGAEEGFVWIVSGVAEAVGNTE